MAVTYIETLMKYQIMHIMRTKGYPKYASVLNKFELHLTSDPEVVAYLNLEDGSITVNRGLDTSQIDVIVRHEILHSLLQHAARAEKHLGTDAYNNRTSSQHQALNIAGDYEISNKGYTRRDKGIARSIMLNGQSLQGLVTEDQHPDWVNKSFEEMYDELSKQMSKEEQEALQSIRNFMKNNSESQIQQAEELERQANDISDLLDELGDNELDSAAGVATLLKAAKSQGSKNSNSKGSSAPSDDKKSGDQDAAGSSDAAEEAADKMDKIANAAGKLADEIRQDQEERISKGEILDSPQQRKDAERRARRVAELKKIFDDTARSSEIVKEASSRVVKERKKIEADKQAYKKFKESVYIRFQNSLLGFMRNYISTYETTDWSKISRRYGTTPIIEPGRYEGEKKNIPSINIYYDNSGSWNAEKIRHGNAIIQKLRPYEDKGKLKMNVYYFSDGAPSSTPLSGGGTSLQGVYKHIQSTQPDNVVIMTDADTNGESLPSITVPGGVWLIFVDGTSNACIKTLHGKMKTEVFEVDTKYVK